MSVYEKRTFATSEWAGESFTKILSRDNESVYDADDLFTIELIDDTGTIVYIGDGIKSGDGLSFSMHVPKETTVGLEGKYVILIYRENASDSTVKDVTVEYKVRYKIKKA